MFYHHQTFIYYAQQLGVPIARLKTIKTLFKHQIGARRENFKPPGVKRKGWGRKLFYSTGHAFAEPLC